MASQLRLHRSNTNRPLLRNAYSSLEMYYDSDSDNSPKASPVRRITAAKSFPPVTPFHDDEDDDSDREQAYTPSSNQARQALMRLASSPSRSEYEQSTGTYDIATGRTTAHQESEHELPQHSQELKQQLVKHRFQQPRQKTGEVINEVSMAENRDPTDDFDAQTLYSPQACLFVANLHQNFDDLTLKSEVTKAFSQFGTVFAKIKRDRRHMPFAFCQYTDSKDAEKAFTLGRGMEILGRGCRIEKCNANLVYIVYKKNCRRIQAQEAHSLMSAYGLIRKIEDLDAKVQKRLNLPQTILIEYEMFDPRRDVIRSIGPDSIYIVMAYDSKMSRLPSERDPDNPHDYTFMELYDKDRRSVYFGNLPLDTASHWVEKVAATISKVLSVEMKQPKDPNSTCIFAFVEFDRPGAPDEAIAIYNNKIIEGVFLRVERKKSRASTAVIPLIPPRGASLGQATPPSRPFRRASRPEVESPSRQLTAAAMSITSDSHVPAALSSHKRKASGNTNGSTHALVPTYHDSAASTYGSSRAMLPTPVQQSASYAQYHEQSTTSKKDTYPNPAPHQHTRQRSVHFDIPSSPSQAASPEIEYHHPQPIPHALNAQGGSFADRIALRAVTYGDASTARRAAERAERIADTMELDRTRRVVSEYVAEPAATHTMEHRHIQGISASHHAGQTQSATMFERGPQTPRMELGGGMEGPVESNGYGLVGDTPQSAQENAHVLFAARAHSAAFDPHHVVAQGLQQSPYIPMMAPQHYPQIYRYPAGPMHVELSSHGSHYMTRPDPQGLVASRVSYQSPQQMAAHPSAPERMVHQLQTYVPLPMPYGYSPTMASARMPMMDTRGNIVYAQMISPPLESPQTPLASQGGEKGGV